MGGEKELEETRSSERFLVSTLSSVWTDLGLGMGITLAGEARRMESCDVKKFSLTHLLSQYAIYTQMFTHTQWLYIYTDKNPYNTN